MAASNALTTLFGDTLLTKDGNRPTSEVLTGKITMLYFSAHWCGPCRGFTPQLVEQYHDYKKAGLNVECVFVSSDRDEKSFLEYYGEMPWAALPYSERETKESLSKKFKCKGIPHLVILDEDGSLITLDGRSAVSSDPTGAEFPWRPKPVRELLGEALVDKTGASVPVSSLEGKSLALYFSAHWCPPCRGFTPKLAELYDEMKASGRDDFEFIFVSSDHDQASFDEYLGEMPWLALPFDNRGAKAALSSMFGVRGIPSLVTIDAEGNTINKSARGPAGEADAASSFPWHPKPVEDISAGVDCMGFDINEKPALVLLCDGASDETSAAALAAVTPIAEDIAAKAKTAEDKEPELLVFHTSSGAGPVGQVRKLTKQPDATTTPTMLLLDIPDNGGFYVSDQETIDGDTITAFLEAYRAGALERQQMGK